MTVSRKEKRNIGPVELGVPTLVSARKSILYVERVIKRLLQNTIDFLKADANQADLERFFSHFFDDTVSVAERNAFITNFRKSPPKVILGYARSGAQFPLYSIVMESENETEKVLSDYVGESLPGEVGETSEYEGTFFDSIYGIYVYAEHPDVCIYLYQLAKSVMVGGGHYLIDNGIHETSLSGGELAPDENYMPDNMFVRVLRVTCTTTLTVPRLMDPDPNKIRITGIYREDVVVDGVRGGVVTYDGGDEE